MTALLQKTEAARPGVIPIDAAQARLRGLPATDGATVLVADRPLYRVDLQCPDCIHEPVCEIRKRLKSTSFEVRRPDDLPPEFSFVGAPEVDCSQFIASEEIFVQAGMAPEGRPLWQTLLSYAIFGLACACAVAELYQAGWLY